MSAGYVAEAKPDMAAQALRAVRDVGEGEHPGFLDLVDCFVDQSPVKGPFVIRVLHEEFTVRAERDGDEVVIVLSAKGEVELERESEGVAGGEYHVEMEQGCVVYLDAVSGVSEGSHDAEPTSEKAVE